jgi:hypothetical protein
MSELFNKNRIDCVLVWGHGLPKLDNILKDIRNKNEFEILKIQKYKPRSIKRFVKEIYSYDYAPFWHLKDKTRYLRKTPKEVCFIFFKNTFPNEEYLGENNFRHKESLTLKKFKEELRDKYNPYVQGERTHDHVIHATDSQEQADYILKYLGYKEGVTVFRNPTRIFDCPYYIEKSNKYRFRQIKVSKLYCNIVEGKSWDDCETKAVPITNSPQYIGLTENMEIYKNYINRYRGGPLQEDYNLERFLKLKYNFNYLSQPHCSAFVIVAEINEKYLVLDGLHRVCIHISQKNNEIKVCQVNA